MKILSIKRRFFMNPFSVYEWKVKVDMGNGVEKTFNCWASINNPNADDLLFSLKIKIKELKFPNELIGKEINL